MLIFYIVVSLSALAVIFGTFVIRRFIKRCVDKAEKREIATARKKKNKSDAARSAKRRKTPRGSIASETCALSVLKEAESIDHTESQSRLAERKLSSKHKSQRRPLLLADDNSDDSSCCKNVETSSKKKSNRSKKEASKDRRNKN